MTPETGENVVLDETLSELGVGSVDELKTIVAKQKNRDGFDRRKAEQMEELQRKVEELETRGIEDDLGVEPNSNEVTKRMARQILVLQRQIGTLTDRVVASPEDEELQEYMTQAEHDNPEIAKITDPIRRKTLLRRIARDLKAETEGSSGRNKGRSKDTSAAHLSGGGSPVSQRSNISEEQALERYQNERAAASAAEKEAVDARYRAKYPDWGI